jgi:exopolysaccharide biosynthesis polyprenyl glycosylphosphotransferase
MLRKNWRSLFILIAIIVDTVAIIASSITALYFRNFIPHLTRYPEEVYINLTMYFGVVYILFGLIIGLYRTAYHSNRIQQYKLASKTYVFGTLLILASLFVLQYNYFPRRFTFIFFGFLPLFFILGRVLLHRFNIFMQMYGFGIHNTLIVGYDNGGREIVNRFVGFPELGYNVKGFVSRSSDVKSEQPMYSIKDLLEVVDNNSIDRMFIPSSKLITNGYSEIVEICRKKNIKLKVLSPESDRLLRMTHVHDIAGITLYAPERLRIAAFRGFIKRIFDIAVSSILILILSPVFTFCAFAIYLESGRPIIFKHRRTSVKGGKEFDFYKFRSMVDGAEELREELFQFNESDGALFKMKNDPRMTRVGKFIRKFSIDELPQLFNVLKGDMSLVGPRPLPPEDFERLEEGPEFWEAVKYRERMKPGITGLWQISGRSHIGFREMILLDLYYVENQSLLFDMEILFETFTVVLFGRGAY